MNFRKLIPPAFDEEQEAAGSPQRRKALFRLRMTTRFRDRRDAGKFLARKLAHLAPDPNLIILALPRGGVPVAYEVARELGAPLDIFIVRKLGVPDYEELAMGAIASGGVRVLNEDVIRKFGVTPQVLDSVTAEEQRELERRERDYRGDREPLELTGRTVVLVDDGLATGATMRAGALALRRKNPKRIVVAAPVGAPDTCAEFAGEVDEVVCARCPEDFTSVSLSYHDFAQTTDEEVRDLLLRAALAPG
jgi:putative phosphoribosyl transferase